MAKNPRRPKPSRPSPDSPVPRRRFRWSYAAFFTIGVGLAVLVLLSLPSAAHRPHPGQGNPTAPTPPWGHLEYTRFHLERPDEVGLLNSPPAPPTRWVFDNYAEADLQRFLSAPDLAPDQSSRLLDKARWIRTATGWQVTPPLDLVENLTQATRVRIYSVLRKNPQNQLHFFPFFIASTSFEEWLGRWGFSADMQALIRKVAYPLADSICLSDFELLESRATPAEKKLLIRAISFNPALLMKIRITQDTDVAALERYWGRAGRMKAMKPLLEAIAHDPEGDVLNVSAFFPEFARMRLYTFPNPDTDTHALREDCYWTALNFFKEEPDNRYLVDGPARQAMKSDYIEVKTNWAFGDILVLMEDGKDAKHMCVYVADDVVFTKNGAVPWAPWTLMRMPDMLTRYTSDKQISIIALRHKGT